LPRELRRHTLRARADSQLVRFYEHGELVKMHARVAAGKRSIDPANFPEESLACAQRDAAFFVCQAAERRAPRPLRGPRSPPGRGRGPGCASTSSCSASPASMAAVSTRVARTALAADMVDVYRLADLVRLDTRLSPRPAKVIPLARYLRPASQYAPPPLARSERPIRRRRTVNADIIFPELKTVRQSLRRHPASGKWGRAAWSPSSVASSVRPAPVRGGTIPRGSVREAGVHDADLGVHDAPIRCSRSRSSCSR
jgi:hypothetical protein